MADNAFKCHISASKGPKMEKLVILPVSIFNTIALPEAKPVCKHCILSSQSSGKFSVCHEADAILQLNTAYPGQVSAWQSGHTATDKRYNQ